MSLLVSTLMSVTTALGIPPGLLSAVCYVESGHRPHAINRKDGIGDSLGLCQIKHTTAKIVGFKGTRETLWKNPKINVYYSGRYLKKQIIRYKGDIRKAVAAYNMGTYKEDATGKAYNHLYVEKVFKAWAENR